MDDGPVGVVSRLISVMVTSSLGPYIHLAAGRTAPGELEKDATVRGEMRDRIKEGLSTNMRLNQFHLAGSGH